MILFYVMKKMPGQPIPIKPVVKRERAMELTDDLKSFKARYIPFKIFLRVGYETTYASRKDHHIFSGLCHCQT